MPLKRKRNKFNYRRIKRKKPTSSEIPGRAEELSRTQDDGLCARCAKLNLDAVLSRQNHTGRGELLEDLGPVANWAIDSCPLCNLMAATLPFFECGQSDTSYLLRSHSSCEYSWMGWSSVNTVMLQVGIPTADSSYDIDPSVGFLVPRCEGVHYVRELKEDAVDFDIFKSWLDFCQDGHTKSCGVRSSTSVPSLKLIDCKTRRLVPALNHKYLTLSYLWGPNQKSSSMKEALELLPGDLPDTIEDAITVTRKLGFRYLWIDRYCIKQNTEEAHAQIRQMDLIYRNSEVTIIAAAGRDPSYGLPGVGHRRRIRQPRAKIGKHFLLSTLQDPRVLIKGFFLDVQGMDLSRSSIV